MTELLDEFILTQKVSFLTQIGFQSSKKVKNFQKTFNPEWTPKFGSKEPGVKDFQVQLNRARRIMATQVPLAAGETGHKFVLEVHHMD